VNYDVNDCYRNIDIIRLKVSLLYDFLKNAYWKRLNFYYRHKSQGSPY
jgi:hypothetical protein